ncbi:MAG: hypothetical protein IJ498_09165 [Akkermansia sp.]|nr:hypothetical protein [Akkermansia sp.]
MKSGFFMIAGLALFVGGCRQVVYTVNMKQISPEVRAAAARPDSWYAWLPERSPGFCLITRHAVVWRDLEMNLGCWRARHPLPPHRMMMEARGDTFILHRRYIWDGMTWGCTRPRDLMPTLLHDALYHALQNGAPVSRREIDRLFLRLRRQNGEGSAYAEYLGIRIAGGLFNAAGEKGSLLIETEPSPPAALEPDRPEPLAGESAD